MMSVAPNSNPHGSNLKSERKLYETTVLLMQLMTYIFYNIPNF